MNYVDDYRTANLALAAYLITATDAELLGAQVGGVACNVEFVLSREPTGEEVSVFFGGTGLVSALKFSEALSRLKSVVHETTRLRREPRIMEATHV